MSSDLLIQKPDDRKMANLVLQHWGTWEEDQPFFTDPPGDFYLQLVH